MLEQVCEGNKVYGQRNGDAMWSWGLGYRVTSLYLFTDRRVQRWLRCVPFQEQGLSLILEACLLIFLSDLSSRERIAEAGS